MATLPTIVHGNSFALAIPLKVYVIGEGEVVLVDYTPDEGDSITVQLRGNRRVYSYTPTTEGNVATIALAGNELAGIYDTVVTIIKDDDTHLRAFKSGQLVIVESVDDMTEGELADGINAGAIYLDPQIFIRGEQGEDGRGIVSITKTATTGLVDTYTITYTDGTTSTFTVTNGADGQDGQDGADGVGIASITEQTSSASGGVNVVTVILTDGTTSSFTVRNGIDGQTPDMSQYALKTDLAAKADLNGSGNEDFAADTLRASNVVFGGYATISGAAPTIQVSNTIGGSTVQFPYDRSGTLALISDIISQLANYCPIIEDTRSSSVANITGVAPFATLVDGQRIVLHMAFPNLTNPTLQLTLSNGTPTSAYDIYGQISTNVMKLLQGYYRAEAYLPMIFASNRWNVIADANTLYDGLTQAILNVGTDMNNRLISAKLIHDNAYIVEETYSSGSLKANKFYDFGTVSTALTIPTLDATNDLVSNALNFYALRFIAGADNLSITFPTGVIVDDTPTINTGDYVEIMINKYGNNFYASIKVWQTQ